MWLGEWRKDAWQKLREPWDLLIVGGGITGAGILAEAARLGKRALLVEARDFAYGTSSRSTKLVHGGLRYLRQGQFLVTRKSVKERERLMDEGGGLVENLGFSLATFPGDEVPRWMYGMGLFMYDALAWKWAHERLSKPELLDRLPMLEGSDVTGGYHYFDAQTDDARLVLRVISDGLHAGGTAINYARVSNLLRDKNGTVCGAVVEDHGPEKYPTEEVRAKVVINATGAWADDLRKHVGAEARMRKIRGSHVTFLRERLPVREAVSLLHPKDGRAVFAVPWEGVTILGTTDKDHAPSLDEEPRISDEEVDYLLECAARAFPSLGLKHHDVIGSWAGVRPVINTGKSDPSKESREHAVWREEGLLTIAGGKLTTFAVMARDALAAVEDAIGPLGPRGHVIAPPTKELCWRAGVDDSMRARLFGRHGQAGPEISAKDEWTKTIGATPVLTGELVYAARAEAVVHLEDLLLRRARLGFLLPGGGLREMSMIRALVGPELGWSDARWTEEIATYEKLWKTSYAGK